MCICVQGHVNVYTLFVKKEISSDIVSLCVHVHPFVCGRECIRGPTVKQPNDHPHDMVQNTALMGDYIGRYLRLLDPNRPSDALSPTHKWMHMNT